jgi:hypothetical protein
VRSPNAGRWATVIAFSIFVSIAHADDRYEQRAGFIDCGGAQVRGTR